MLHTVVYTTFQTYAITNSQYGLPLSKLIKLCTKKFINYPYMWIRTI